MSFKKLPPNKTRRADSKQAQVLCYAANRRDHCHHDASNRLAAALGPRLSNAGV
jgi:hypothetical protein